MLKDNSTLTEFPLHSFDKLRYSDTDRQGHINNAVFATFLETGRVEFLYKMATPIAEPGTAFVLARLELDLRQEMTWPGEVAIGTKIESVGRSSLKLRQGLFQNDQCVALALTVIVLIDAQTHRSSAFSPASLARIAALQTGVTAPSVS